VKHLKEVRQFFEDVSVYADGGNDAVAKGNLFPERARLGKIKDPTKENFKKYEDLKCPVCQEPARYRQKCRDGDFSCDAGHTWKYKDSLVEIEETAIPAEELVKPEAHLGLLFREETSLGILEKTLVLWNFQEKKIMGAADIEWDDDMKHWVVWKTAGEKNYGPDIYDFALMAGYPDGVMPSHTIRPAARKVWMYYMDHRSDVTKEIIHPGSHKYRKDYIKDQEHENEPESDPAVLKAINAVYYLKPSKEYYELISDGEKYCQQYNIKASVIMSDKKFNDYFNSKYRPMEDELAK
jgi:hypothetical protein